MVLVLGIGLLAGTAGQFFLVEEYGTLSVLVTYGVTAVGVVRVETGTAFHPVASCPAIEQGDPGSTVQFVIAVVTEELVRDSATRAEAREELIDQHGAMPCSASCQHSQRALRPRAFERVQSLHDLSNRGPATPRDCFDSIFEPMVQLPTGTDSTQRRKVGWLTGLEPATTGITIRDSTN